MIKPTLIGCRVLSDDPRRIIFSLFDAKSNKLPNINTGEVNLIRVKDPRAVMGNHYHDFDELFYFLSGRGKFTVEDPESRVRSEYTLNENSGLFMPTGLPHALVAEEGTSLISVLGGEFIPEVTVHPYRIL